MFIDAEGEFPIRQFCRHLSKGCSEHRLIYRQDQDKVNAYKEWKSLMRKQFSTSKEKHGSYDAAAIAEEIRTTIKSIMVPKIE